MFLHLFNKVADINALYVTVVSGDLAWFFFLEDHHSTSIPDLPASFVIEAPRLPSAFVSKKRTCPDSVSLLLLYFCRLRAESGAMSLDGLSSCVLGVNCLALCGCQINSFGCGPSFWLCLSILSVCMELSLLWSFVFLFRAVTHVTRSIVVVSCGLPFRSSPLVITCAHHLPTCYCSASAIYLSKVAPS